MEATAYLQRHAQCTTYPDKQALVADLFEQDNVLRKLFSQQRDSWEVPELGEDSNRFLVPVFGNDDAFKCSALYPEEAAVPKVFPLGDKRKAPGAPSTLTKPEFLRNFDLFTEGMLKALNWDNVFSAGGSVMACLQPLPAEHDDCNRSRRKYFHDVGYPGSDVDLFLYGLDGEAARRKIVEIYDAVRESAPFDVLCFRSAHAITLVSQYPYRHIQIVLRLYSSPSEVLAGFDVDSCAVGFDGTQVMMAPRCHLALVDQINSINLTRRSPTYEMRLAKYAGRGFEVAVPGLQRARINPLLYEASWNRVQGLAKLLLLEKLQTPEARFRYKEAHRAKKMQPMYTSSFASKFHFRAMLSSPWLMHRLEGVRGGSDASDYSTVFLPWGPGWDAKRCSKLMAAKDRMLNNPYVNRRRPYNLHPATWGSAEEILGDQHPDDKAIPADVDPKVLEPYVRGPLTFIEDDPGRQMIGSFHPINEGDWSEGAYMSVETEKVILSANAGNLEAVEKLLDGGVSPSAVDAYGRSVLHIATLGGWVEIVKLLVARGAKLAMRMPDGRTALHLAAAYGRGEIVDVLVAAAKERAAAAPVAGEAKEEKEDMDWEKAGGEDDDEDDDEGDDEDDEDRPKRRKPAAKDEEAAEAEEPDVLDLDATDWERYMTAMHYAITFGHVDIVEKLIAAGADATKGVVHADNEQDVQTPIMLVGRLFLWLPEAGKKLLSMLRAAGNTLLRLDNCFRSYLHLACDNVKFLSALMEEEPEIKKLVNVVSADRTLPLSTALEYPEAVKLLLAAGAKVKLEAADVELARKRFVAEKAALAALSSYQQNTLKNLQLSDISDPIKTSYNSLQLKLNNMDDEDLDELDLEEQDASMGGRTEPSAGKELRGFAKAWQVHQLLLAAGGVDLNVVVDEKTLLDLVEEKLESFKERAASLKTFAETKLPSGMSLHDFIEALRNTDLNNDGKPLPALVHQQGADAVASFLVSHAGSYLADWVEGRSLQEQVSLLGVMLVAWSASHRTQITAAVKLITQLRAMGAKKASELPKPEKPAGEGDDDDEDTPAASPSRRHYHFNNREDRCLDAWKTLLASSLTLLPGKVERKLLTYYMLPELDQVMHSSHNSIMLPKDTAAEYEALFQAVWQGDAAAVTSMTAVQEDGSPRVYVAVHDSFGLTPLSLAVVRGDTAMAQLIMDIAAAQYVPFVVDKPEDGEDMTKINNYALQMHMEAAEEDADSDDEAEEDADDPDGLVEEIKQMREEEEAKKAARKVAVAGIVLKDEEAGGEEGAVIKTVCHVPPQCLIYWQSSIPESLLQQCAGEDYTLPYREFLGKLLKALKADVALEKLMVKINALPSHQWWYNVYGDFQGLNNFLRMNPLLLAIVTKRADSLSQLFELHAKAVEHTAKADAAASSSTTTTAAAATAATPEAMEEDGDEPMEEAPAAKGAAASPDTLQPLRKLLANTHYPKSMLQFATYFDAVDCFKVVLEYMGLSEMEIFIDAQQVTHIHSDSPYTVSDINTEDAKGRSSRLRQKGETKWQAVMRAMDRPLSILQACSPLHFALRCDAPGIAQWLLSGDGPAEVLSKHVARVVASGKAAKRNILAMASLVRKAVGDAAEAATDGQVLASYFCSNLELTDCNQYTPFHWLCFAAKGAATLQALASPQVLEGINMVPASLDPKDPVRGLDKKWVNAVTNSYTSFSPLQLAAHYGCKDVFLAMLEAGADPLVPDSNKKRGFNLLAFIINKSDHHGFPKARVDVVLDMVVALFSQLTQEQRVAMIEERMGESKITPLMLATYNGLIANKYGTATVSGDPVAKVVRLLLEAGGAAATAAYQSCAGRTALQMAVAESMIPQVQLLVKAEPTEALPEGSIPAAGVEDYVGLTPLDVAMAKVLASSSDKTPAIDVLRNNKELEKEKEKEAAEDALLIQKGVAELAVTEEAEGEADPRLQAPTALAVYQMVKDAWPAATRRMATLDEVQSNRSEGAAAATEAASSGYRSFYSSYTPPPEDEVRKAQNLCVAALPTGYTGTMPLNIMVPEPPLKSMADQARRHIVRK